MSKRLKVIFTLSVILNFVLIGLVVGHGYKAFSPHHFKDVDMSPETRATMKAALKEKHEKIRKVMHDIRAKKKNLEEVMSASEFDVNAYDTAIEDWRSYSGVLIDDKKVFFREMLLKLPQAEREKIAPKFVSILVGHDKRRGSKSDCGKWKEKDDLGKQP